MPDAFHHLALSMVDDVAVVEVTSPDLVGPALAEGLGAELAAVAGQEWAARMVVDFRKVRHLSSTALAVLVRLATRAGAAGRRVSFCGMQPGVRLGADIAGLGKVAEVHDGLGPALAAFADAGRADPAPSPPG